MSTKRRWGRRLARCAAGLGLLWLFSLSLAGGAALHAGTPPMRRLVRRIANAVLARSYLGRLELGSIEALGPRGLRIAFFRVATPSGEQLAEVRGVRIEGPLLAGAVGLLLGPPVLQVDFARVEQAHIALGFDEQGRSTLARAFALRRQTAEPDTEAPRAPSSPARLHLRRVEIGRVSVSGTLGRGVPIDAVVSRLLASIEVADGAVSLDVARSSLAERKLLGATTQGTADFHLRASGEPRRLGLWGTFTGQVGLLELVARAALADGRVDVALSLPKVGRRELAPWLPGAPIELPLSAEARFGGHGPLFDLTGSVALPAVGPAPAGRLTMRGKLLVGEKSSLDAELSATAIDLRVFRADLAETSLNAHAHLRGRLAGPASRLRAQLAIGGRVGLASWPTLSGTVALAQAASGAWLQAEPPGGQLLAGARYRKRVGLDFDLSASGDLATAVRLSRRLGLGRSLPSLGGRAALLAGGRIGPEQLNVAARLDLRALSLPSAGAKLGRGRLFARIGGSTASPTVDVQARGGGVRVGRADLQQLTVTAHGPLVSSELHVTARDPQGRDFELAGELDATRPSLHHARIVVTKGDARLEGAVGELSATAAGPRAVGVRLIRLDDKELRGALRVEGGELTGKLEGDEIELEPLSTLLGLPYPLRGRARVDIDLRRDAAGRHGHARLRVTDASMLVVSGVSADIDTEFDGEQIRGQARLRLSGEHPRAGASKDPCEGVIVAVDLNDAATALAGPLLSAASWRRAPISGQVALREAKLRCLAQLWEQFDPTRALPIERLEGVVSGQLGFRHRAGAAWPSIDDLSVATRGLAVVTRRPSQTTPPAWRSEHLDLALSGSFDEPSGQAGLRVALLGDAHGDAPRQVELASLSARLKLDPDELSAGGERARQALWHAPLSAELHAARRSLAAWGVALPGSMGTPLAAVRGDVQLEGFARGSLHDPAVAIRARAWRLRAAAEPRARPHAAGGAIDADVMASYGGGQGRLDAWVRNNGARIAFVEGTLRGNPVARLAGSYDERWQGSVRVGLRDLPLGAIPTLGRAEVTGELNGELSVQELGRTPQLRGDLRLTSLALQGQPLLRQAHAHVRSLSSAEEGTVTLQAEVDPTAGGRATVTGYGSLAWWRGIWPRADTDAPAALLFTAQALRLRALQPLMGRTVSKLDGRLDGAVRLTHKELLGHDASIDVDLSLRDGVVHFPAAGQELHDIAAHLSSSPKLIRVDDIRVSASSGHGQGWLLVRHDDLKLRDVTGSFSVPRDAPMPLMVEGVALGTASGTLIASLQQPDGQLALALTAAGLRIHLPPSASRRVQPLGDNPAVHTSAPLGPGADSATAPTKRPLRLTLALADAAITGPSLDVAFATTPQHEIRAADGDLSGEISLSSGHLDLLGKVFEIDRGLVRLRRQEPRNPYVTLTAHYSAPDGSVIYCDFAGPLKPLSRDKLHFRSQPPRPEREILAELLFGSAGAGGGAELSGGGRATGLGRGLAAAQLNSALAEAAPGLSTGMSSSQGAVRTSVSYQLSDQLSAQATYERSQSAQPSDAQGQGTAPSKPESTTNTRLSFDWLFAPHWLLRGSFGVGDDPSTGLDLLFQHRY